MGGSEPSDVRSLAAHEWKEVWPCETTNLPVALPAHLAPSAPAELLVFPGCRDVIAGVGIEKVLVAALCGCLPQGGTSLSVPT